MKLSTIIQDVVDAGKDDPFFIASSSVGKDILDFLHAPLSKTDEFKDCELSIMDRIPTDMEKSQLITAMLHENSKFTGKVQLFDFYFAVPYSAIEMEANPELTKEAWNTRAVMIRGIIENLEGLGDGEKMIITRSPSDAS